MLSKEDLLAEVAAQEAQQRHLREQHDRCEGALLMARHLLAKLERREAAEAAAAEADRRLGAAGDTGEAP